MVVDCSPSPQADSPNAARSIEQASVDRIFHALADATRRDIVQRVLTFGECSVSALARRYPMSIAAVQKHVGVLEQAELVTKTRRGREQLVNVRIDTVRHAMERLDEFEALWRHRIDRMRDILAEEPGDNT